MRLSSKSTIYFILTTLIVFLFSGIGIYFLLQMVIHHEIDEDLIDKKIEILQKVKDAGGFEQLILPNDGRISIRLIPLNKNKPEDVFSDTVLTVYDYEDHEYESEPFRKLQFGITFNGEARLITIKMSLIKSDDLIEVIILSMILVFAIMLAALITVNFLTMRHLWHPFQVTLGRMRNFDFRSSEQFESVKSNISEFNELNSELTKMTTKLTHDYFSLKEYSENASHEMQTPLAIIQAKLELLFQNPNLDEHHLKALKAAYQATNRMSRLHHELNLLSRIENKEFTKKSSVNFCELLETQVDNFVDIIQMKNLTLNNQFNAEPVIAGNSYLLEILVSNLLGNAIRHNIENGSISINLTRKALIFINSGPAPDFPTEQLFERFRKGKATSDSTGLGLSLIKQICLLHGFSIRYTFQNKLHTIEIQF